MYIRTTFTVVQHSKIFCYALPKSRKQRSLSRFKCSFCVLCMVAIIFPSCLECASLVPYLWWEKHMASLNWGHTNAVLGKCKSSLHCALPKSSNTNFCFSLTLLKKKYNSKLPKVIPVSFSKWQLHGQEKVNKDSCKLNWQRYYKTNRNWNAPVRFHLLQIIIQPCDLIDLLALYQILIIINHFLTQFFHYHIFLVYNLDSFGHPWKPLSWYDTKLIDT